MTVSIEKYGRVWKCVGKTQAQNSIGIEMECIKRGGKWKEGDKECGAGLFHHYREFMSLAWPKDDHHRWSDLILSNYCAEEITVLLGCSDSSKTFTMSKIILVDYWCFPDETLWLVSTTEGRGSELRIWGCIKDLFNSGRKLFPWLPGNPIDYLKTITTETIDEEKFEARSLRRGIIVVPCKTGGLSSGLAPYIGIKAPRLRHAGDEVAVMSENFLNAYSNWYGKEDFKGIMSGNFLETDDPLGVASEPTGGWDSFEDSGKTQEWRSTFYGAKVVALDGRDSPNFDFPPQENGRQKYPYLISQKKLNGVSSTKGENSWEWFSQCVGKPAKGMDIWRVLNKDFCTLHHASESVIWKGTAKIQIYGIDPAYGGGDDCVGRRIEFGQDIDGKQILLTHPPDIIPIMRNIKTDPEDQIAAYVQKRLVQLDIVPQNCFYDSFGRGTLGSAFSKVFGHTCPVPVDSGAMPTKRPVRFDLFIIEKDGTRRLKRCDEHYTKFISEMWFSVRESISCEQVRGLDAETIREGCSRKFSKNANNKIEVEPKDEMKARLSGKSPNRMDAFAIALEGARQRGFKIEDVSKPATEEKKKDWLDKKREDWKWLLKSKQLKRAA